MLPNPDYKFYVTAGVGVRALRRYKELVEKGHDVDLKSLEKEIEQRDFNDSNRDFAPLRMADDAVLIDTSDMTVEEVVGKILTYVNAGVK